MSFADFRYVTAGRGGTGLAGFVALGLLVLAFAGCSARRPPKVEATELPVEPGPPATGARRATEASDAGSGVHHVVARGQTLWSIARAYELTVDELVRANSLDDPTRLDTGQRLWIPGATAVLEVGPTAPAAGPLFAGVTLVWPVSGGEVLSPFGAVRGGRRHQGLDIRGRHGEPVRAIAAGRVTYSGATSGAYGKMVVLDHGQGLSSLYAHNSELLVEEGQLVDIGQTIARVGRTGNASGHHVHLEVRRDATPVDPLPLLPAELEARR